MTISEKIDGTSVTVWVPEDPALPLVFGSRNRFITPGKTTDNYGFAEWGMANMEALRRLGPGCHRGEWWGAGIARRYALAERRWSLFNTSQYTPELLKEMALPSNVHAVPVLYTGPPSWALTSNAIDQLVRDGSHAAPGFMNPEGIVLWHRASGQHFKWTTGGDALTELKTPSPVENP